jgi:dihydrofolate reductase
VAELHGAVRRPVEEVRGLKAEPGRDIVLTGSIRLCHTLIGAGLVDEYRLFVYPAVQGLSDLRCNWPGHAEVAWREGPAVTETIEPMAAQIDQQRLAEDLVAQA